MLVGSFPLLASDPDFLVLSDIHFNPVAQPSYAKELALADVRDWAPILSRAPSGLSRYAEDTNWSLLQSVLHRLSELPEKPKFLLLTGDLLAHHLRDHYEQAVPDGPDFAAFSQKTTQFLERQIKAALPGVPIIIALGNNDGDCADGDYTIEPGGAYLRNTLPAIADAARVSPSDIEESWNEFSGYDIDHPTLNRTRILVLNTTFLSWRYQNKCGHEGDDPGLHLLAWLEKRLGSARARKQKVWLVYHIPPGIDGYASTHQRPPNVDRVITLWNPRYQAEFEKILQEYAGTVQNQFAGHTHFDDFRLLGRPDAYSSFVLLSPGISPNVSQNPALREVRFRSDGTLTDLKTWYLPLSDSSPEWKLGYQFRREWKARAVDLPSLSSLYSQIRDSAEVRAKWEQVYSVWTLGEKGMTKRDSAATVCATGYSGAEGFRTCFCEQDSSGAFCARSSKDGSRASVQSRLQQSP